MWRCLAVVPVAGCYLSGGLGYAGGDAATAHLSVGIAVPIGARANARVGGDIAIGASEDVVPGPVEVGGDMTLVGGRDALSAVADVALPVGGNWTSQDRDREQNVGRVYVGAGYSHTPIRHDKAKDEDRATGVLVVSAGPEMFWAGSDVKLGASFDILVMVRAWTVVEALDSKH